jgi:hypothetical protein
MSRIVGADSGESFIGRPLSVGLDRAVQRPPGYPQQGLHRIIELGACDAVVGRGTTATTLDGVRRSALDGRSEAPGKERRA